MNKHIILLFFLLFCGVIPVWAQVASQLINGNGTIQNAMYALGKLEKETLADSIEQKNVGAETKGSAKVDLLGQQIGGKGNTQYNINITNNVSKNEKELAQLKKEVKRGIARLDSLLFIQKKKEEEREKMKTFFHEKILEKDSAYRVLEKEREDLQKEYDVLGSTLALHKEWIAKLDSVIQIQRKGNFLPLGIKQCQNGRKALGYTFLVSEIAVPIALGFGLEHAADQKYKKYKRQQAETLSDHEGYYKDYKNYHRAAI